MPTKEKLLKIMCNYCNWYIKTLGNAPGYPTLIIFALVLLLGSN
ncbi:MAG: hypothetical protein PHD81_02080 [Candidatus Nanoarchaeia archaeon]|nr:hypothetical protein [Candidatus Nanoarchaeia archaeon]MDD5587878.1 hypothetical protein [Candidatus Nanoarchaeia archaeon]